MGGESLTIFILNLGGSPAPPCLAPVTLVHPSRTPQHQLSNLLGVLGCPRVILLTTQYLVFDDAFLARGALRTGGTAGHR